MRTDTVVALTAGSCCSCCWWCGIISEPAADSPPAAMPPTLLLPSTIDDTADLMLLFSSIIIILRIFSIGDDCCSSSSSSSSSISTRVVRGCLDSLDFTGRWRRQLSPDSFHLFAWRRKRREKMSRHAECGPSSVSVQRQLGSKNASCHSFLLLSHFPLYFVNQIRIMRHTSKSSRWLTWKEEKRMKKKTHARRSVAGWLGTHRPSHNLTFPFWRLTHQSLGVCLYLHNTHKERNKKKKGNKIPE